MVDITHKSNTLREATAQAIVKVSKQDTIDAITIKVAFVCPNQKYNRGRSGVKSQHQK